MKEISIMESELSPDWAEEMEKMLQDIFNNVERMNKEIEEKDKKILELENKLKQFGQNGS